MNLENQTPFPTLAYAAADPNGEEHRIVVMKVSYKMLRTGQTQWDLALIQDGSVPLCFEDEYWGEMGQSSVRYESDLAPYKPKCDVIINGNAYTQNATPMQAIAVRFRLSQSEKQVAPVAPQAPQPLNPHMPLTESQKKQWQLEQKHYQQALKDQQQVKYNGQIEKTLSVLGESTFKPNVLTPGWKRTKLQTFTTLPMRWDYAFGGAHQLYEDPEATGRAVFEQICYSNPLGSGWVEKSYFDACEKVNQKRKRHQKITDYKHIAAPRIEYHLQRQPKPFFCKQAKLAAQNAQQMAALSQKYAYQPAGLGFTGRAWAPRLALAGTYDQKWIDEQHPYPPQDTDYGYWNGAPADQQIDFFYPNSRLELWNLTPIEFSNQGYVRIDFLGHRPYLKLHFASGELLPWPMLTETVLIDTDQMIISLTHKAWIRADTAPLTRVEACFSDQAEGELFHIEPTE